MPDADITVEALDRILEDGYSATRYEQGGWLSPGAGSRTTENRTALRRRTSW
jgi:hypothetical protein